MKPLIFSVFISSRNNDCFIIDGIKCDSLTEIRLFLQKELESEILLGSQFLKISINETFGADTTLDSYNTCITAVKESDFVIVLFNGNAGWAPPSIKLGICHAELDAALQVSNKKLALIDITEFFELSPTGDDERERNAEYSRYVSTLNRFSNPLKLTKKNRNIDGLKNTLLEQIKKTISNHLTRRIESSNQSFALSNTNTIGLNWKKLKYDDRSKEIKEVLSEIVKKSSDFKHCLTQEHSIPDKMSVEDAKAFTGRPFLNDQTFIASAGKKMKNQAGPIHFIAIYESATEGQVKSMIGYPDISAIKDEFGYYVWEQNTHIQLVFLTECSTPQAIRMKFLFFENWANSSGELERMQSRAKARYHILTAINEAKVIATKR